MRILHSITLALTIAAASVTAAQARDSFSLGINIGGYGYAPQPVYYAAPPVVYYSEPQVYYRPAPRAYYYAPTVVSFGYQNYDHSYRGHHEGRRHGWDNDGRRGYDDRGNNGWNRGRGHHGDRD